MKFMKSFIYMLLCSTAVVFSLSSCLDTGENDNPLPTMTLTDSIEAINDVPGIYTGKLYYIDPTKTSSSNKEDSLIITWTIRKDGMTSGYLTTNNFPIRPLSLYITNTTSMDQSKSILSVAGDQTYTTNVKPYMKLQTTSSNYYQYTIFPKSKEMTFYVNYANSSHKVTVSFADYITDAIGYYYYPIAYKADKLFQGNILIEKVTVDGTEHKIGTVFGIKGHLTSKE